MKRERGSRSRDRHQHGGDTAQHDEYDDGGGHEHRSDALVEGQADHDRNQQGDDDAHEDEIAPARPVPFGADGVAEQRRDRHVVHAAERPQAEGERGQKAVDEGQRELVGMHGRDHRQRQQFSEQADDGKRHRRAERQPNHRADRGEQDDLREIDAEHVAPRGADGLEGRDHLEPAIDMALHGVGDADAADQQCCEADQGQELREAADIAFELRRGIGAAADLPAGLRRGVAGVRDEGIGGTVAVGGVRQFDAVDPAHQAAGLDQPGGAQGRLADQEARTKTDAAGELVGLGLDAAADLEGRRADGDAVADLQREPRQQGRIGGGAECAVALREQIGQRQLRRQRQLSEHRIGVVDRLHLDQRQLAFGRARHAAQGGGHGDGAARAQEGNFLGLRLALEQHEGDVAAEQRAPLAREAVAEARRHRADAGDRHHAERDAGDEDVEAAQAPAQFAQRVAQRQRDAVRPRKRFDSHAHALVVCVSMRPGAQADHAIAAMRERGIVRDQHQRHAALGMLVEEQIDDLLARGLVEIAGRLVGDEDGGIGCQRARERHALLLAAGELRRIMMQAIAEPDRLQLLGCALVGIGIAGELERHGDVLQRRHGRDQMEGLEDDADLAAAEAGQRVLVEGIERRAVDHHLSAIRTLQPRHHHQQRGFARA